MSRNREQRGSGRRRVNQNEARPQTRQERRALQRESQMLAREEYSTERRRGIGPLVGRNKRQVELIRHLLNKELVVINGPAGTAKTFLTTSIAAEALERKEIEQIIITRPMVECGRPMGALPGDEDEKFNPWIENMMEVFRGKFGKVRANNMLASGTILALPLELARGRTFNNAIVILDEAQNASQEQMKMFLTRKGANTKVYICGDADQSDLPRGMISGFDDVIELGEHLSSSWHQYFEFQEDDIVRDPTVKEIIIAYRRMRDRNGIRQVA